MRIPVIAGNWKMNKTASEAVELVAELKQSIAGVRDVDVIVCPPFTAIKAVADALADCPVSVGGQNMHWEESGAYTGEISAAMLLNAGATYVIIGHSERRQYFGETTQSVNKKVKAALASGLAPIVCVGETLEEREAGQTEAVVDDHITHGLAGLSADDMEGIIIAYEPVWAIGTGKTATPEQAQAVHAFIRKRIAELWNATVADATIIQYGGSVKPANVKEIMAKPDIDGGLIGGAALTAESFSQLVRFKEV